MLTTQNKESNYLCKVVELKGIRKHSNADRLQCVNIGMNTVITGLDAKEGGVYVYFPLESKINLDFLVSTRSLRPKEAIEGEPEQKGFFERNARVKAMTLRGERSMGYIVPLHTVMIWALGEDKAREKYCNLEELFNKEFDTINGKLLVEKYEVPRKEARAVTGKQPKLNRLVDGQVNLHIKTKNLRHVPEAITPKDIISITYKTHGTSWWVGNVLAKRKLSLLERVLRKLGVSIPETEYDLIYGSRKVVKNKAFEDPKGQDHFYGYDLWEDIKKEIGHLIPKGWTLYGEMLGYDKNGKEIQKGYDYGCKRTEVWHKLEVYRITQTNPDGLVTELTYPEMKEFCDSVGLTVPHLFFYGKAGDFYNTDYSTTLETWGKNFVSKLEEVYNEKDCFMCDNKVPEEGVVIRKEKLVGCESYKLKSFRFLELETKQLDKGESNIEEEN